MVSIRGWTVSRHVSNLNQLESEKIYWWTISADMNYKRPYPPPGGKELRDKRW